MRYFLTGLLFAVLSVSITWFSGIAHSADDLFGDVNASEPNPFAADLFGDDEDGDPFGADEDGDPFGDVGDDGDFDDEEDDNPFADGGDDGFGGGDGRNRGRATVRQPVQVRRTKRIAGGKTPAELAIRARLDQVLPRVEFDDTSLQDAIEILSEQLDNANIILDETALENAGIDPETPVTKMLRGVTLRSALRLILRGLDLTYQIQDEVLLITTIEEAEQSLTTEVYPVDDLLNKHDVDNSAKSVVDTITSAVSPESWESVGGTGTITCFQRNLVVTQMQTVHENVEVLLDKLREGVKVVGGPNFPDTSGEAVRKNTTKPARGGGGYGGAGGYGAGGGGGDDDGGYGAGGGYGYGGGGGYGGGADDYGGGGGGYGEGGGDAYGDDGGGYGAGGGNPQPRRSRGRSNGR